MTDDSRDWRPVPDPTLLTTQALDHEISNLKELLQSRIEAAERTYEERWQRIEERISSIAAESRQAIEQLRRERELVTAAQNMTIAKAEESTVKALEKAEIATDKRFEIVDTFRSQLTDTISRFLPREVAEAQFTDVRRVLADITEKLSKLA